MTRAGHQLFPHVDRGSPRASAEGGVASQERAAKGTGSHGGRKELAATAVDRQGSLIHRVRTPSLNCTHVLRTRFSSFLAPLAPFLLPFSIAGHTPPSINARLTWPPAHSTLFPMQSAAIRVGADPLLVPKMVSLRAVRSRSSSSAHLTDGM
jgi:hypothetical protein